MGIPRTGFRHSLAAAYDYIDALLANISTGLVSATLATNAATIASNAAKITTESLTTAAGSSQALTITLAGAAIGDLVFVQDTGAGSNTRNVKFTARVTAADTVTVTAKNIEPTNALNGTLIFNLLVLKQ